MTDLRQDTKKQRGFTIVELMIAMAILSVLLTVITVAIMNIGGLYSKGINQSKVQSAARTISDDISSHLQLMGGSTAIGPFSTSPITSLAGHEVKWFCFDDMRYTFVENLQKGSNGLSASNPQVKYVLWRDKVPDCAGAPADLDSSNPSATGGGVDGVELVPSGARLAEFNIIPTGETYEIRLRIAYGDNDLLDGSGSSIRCKGDSSSKYCATVFLKTQVARRL